MHFFLFLNDLAGRFPLLDACARWFYIGAVPLLAILFLVQLLLVPRQNLDDGARIRIALAVVFSMLAVAFIGLSGEYFASYLHLGTLSPRPFMTRRINLLIVEPQDNSFPCYEVALAAIFAIGLGLLSRKWGVFGVFLTVLLGVTRLFCGTSYFADVAVGTLLGGGVCVALGALLQAELHVFGSIFTSKRGWQFGCGSALAAGTLLGTYISLASTPRFSSKLPLWGSAATAASSEPEITAPRKATRAARANITEGEGVSENPPETASEGSTATSHEEETEAPPSAEELALSKRSHLFLPNDEKFLRGKLAHLTRPFQLLDVEVAPVKNGNWSYRCAAIRFEISQTGPDLRRQVAETAARLVKAGFASDSQLQNIDITAILRGDGTQIDGTSLRFAGDEVPVFTASIQRRNLIVSTPRWANDPRLDGGSWLRTRSRLYINEKILPATFLPPAEPQKTPTRAIAPTPSPKSVVLPRADPKPTATATPQKAIEKPKPTSISALPQPHPAIARPSKTPPAPMQMLTKPTPKPLWPVPIPTAPPFFPRAGKTPSPSKKFP